jgi:hypothetical protein
MKRTSFGYIFLRQFVIVVMALAVAAGAMVLSIRFGCCCIGPADAIVKYTQLVEVAVMDLEGRPAAGVKVNYMDVYGPTWSRGPDGQVLFDSAKVEAALQKHRPELLSGVNHQTDASGRAVIPVFVHQLVGVFPLVSLVLKKVDEKGMAGQLYVIVVDDGVNVDNIPLRVLPGISAHGEHWRVEIRSLSTPHEYDYSDDKPSENSAK